MIRWTVLAAFAAALAASAAPAAEGPSIEEMLAVIQKKLAAPEGPAATGPAAPAAEEPVGEFKPYEPKSERIAELQTKINQSVSQRIADDTKNRRWWPLAMAYLDTQKYGEAAGILDGRFISKRPEVGQTGVFDSGEVHRELARLMAIGGRDEQAQSYAAEAVKRATHPHIQRGADGMVKWAADYAQRKAELTRLEAAFAKNPGDADLRWKTADYYRRHVSQYLDEVIALEDMLERFPEHAQTKSGEVEWRLAEGCSRFGLGDDALAIYEAINKDHADYGQVKGGECWWRIAEPYRRKGRWQEARVLYQRMQKEAPGHYVCQVRQGQTKATIVDRIEECNRNIR